MKQIKIKDNSQQKKETFSQVKNLTGKIADKTLEQLEREGVFVFPDTVKDAGDITQDQMILQSVNDTYRSGNVMGFLGCGDERLIIESRFCGGSEDYFFQYLLDKVLDFPNIVNLESDANQGPDVQFLSIPISALPSGSYAKGFVQKVYSAQLQRRECKRYD